jgi:AcrR family transcriptional regulator
MGEGDSRPRKDALRTRRAILDAAYDLFRSDQEASHAEIARAAGVGRASVYRHFPERADIVAALLGEMIDRLGEVAATHDGPIPLIDLLRATAREQAQCQGLISIMRHDGLPPEAFEDLNDRVLALYDEPLATAKRDGTVRGDLTLEEVPMVLAMVEGALTQVGDPVGRGETSSRALDLLLQGVLAN